MNDKGRLGPGVLQGLITRRTAWIAGFLLLLVGAVLVGTLIGRTAPDADVRNPFSADERAAIDAMVRAYILEHPEIIPEAVDRLQTREMAARLDGSRAQVETPFAGAWAGNPEGDVVLVEFFDYACPYCRASKADVDSLIAEDKGLKVVYRDFPVLGPASEEAAMASLSAARQGKYTAFHKALFAGGRPSREGIVAAAREAGMSMPGTARDMTDDRLRGEIRRNLDLGRSLGLTGTPAYLVGDQILSGAVGREALAKAIAAARAGR